MLATSINAPAQLKITCWKPKSTKKHTIYRPKKVRPRNSFIASCSGFSTRCGSSVYGVPRWATLWLDHMLPRCCVEKRPRAASHRFASPVHTQCPWPANRGRINLRRVVSADRVLAVSRVPEAQCADVGRCLPCCSSLERACTQVGLGQKSQLSTYEPSQPEVVWVRRLETPVAMCVNESSTRETGGAVACDSFRRCG
jgi:hypothetical protein